MFSVIPISAVYKKNIKVRLRKFNIIFCVLTNNTMLMISVTYNQKVNFKTKTKTLRSRKKKLNF